MKRYRNGDIWDFESGQGGREVILGLDGGTTSTICICMPLISLSDPFPDPLPLLARAVAGCSNHNSVGGTTSFSVLLIGIGFDFQLECVSNFFDS